MKIIDTYSSLVDEDDKVVLVQIGKSFYRLSKHIEISGARELKELIENKRYSIKLLREE